MFREQKENPETGDPLPIDGVQSHRGNGMALMTQRPRQRKTKTDQEALY